MKTTMSLAAAMAVSAISANAAIIAQYAFTTDLSSSGPLGSNIGFEVGIINNDTALLNNNQLEIQGIDTSSVIDVGHTSYAAADKDEIDGQNWVTFTIAVSDTQELDLSSLTFDYTEIDPASFLLGVYTSKTGFAEGDHLLGLYRSGNNSGTFTDNNGTSVDLSGITALQGLTDETVEFRFLLGDDSGATSRIHVLDNIELNGTVTAVPEPTTAVLLGLGGLALILRRRR